MVDRKIAVLADVHGNLTALEAVIADAKKAGATEFWTLGDIGTYGPGTVESYRLLQAENTTVWLQGNWEHRYVLAEKGEYGTDFESGKEVAFLNWMQRDYAAFSQSELAFIRELPTTQQVTVGEMTINLSHNTPFTNQGDELTGTNPQANFSVLFDTPADLAIYAHVHTPLMRLHHRDELDFSGQRILNTGTVGQATDVRAAGPTAQYLLLTFSEIGLASTDFRRLVFDGEREKQRALAVQWPFADSYINMLAGKYSLAPEDLKGVADWRALQANARAFFVELGHEIS